MLFNSFEFILFFPVAVACYFACPDRYRWAVLLGASYLFYMAWKPGYVVLLWLSTLVDYAAAQAMARFPERRARRPYLILSLCANLGLLFVFKYYNFFADAIRPLLGSGGLAELLPASDLLLPIGISFYTFQTLGYTIDVYRGAIEPERHLGRFALYIAFFPQLVAGPIERAGNLLPQFLERHRFDYDRVTEGLRLMLWGLLKKVVIADRLAVCVDMVYADPSTQPGPLLALATVFFAFQIYCDFSGYSDIAIGAARVMGFRLMDNFRRPYFAGSITEFWGRWHISLSTWFRDYLYLPLGGNRVGRSRWCFNILTVFIVSGLWHGANWKFAVWGLLHGGFLLSERWRGGVKPMVPATGLHRALAIARTFALVCVAWIFFRAATISDAWIVIRGLAFDWNMLLAPNFLQELPQRTGMANGELLLSGTLILGLVGIEWFQGEHGARARVRALPLPLRWAIYSAGLWIIFLFGVLSQREFIYFVF